MLSYFLQQKVNVDNQNHLELEFTVRSKSSILHRLQEVLSKISSTKLARSIRPRLLLFVDFL